MAINPHVSRAFDYIESGKSPKDNVQRVPLNVEGGKFTVSYHIIQHGKNFSTVIVPSTKIRMPVLACIDIPNGGFSAVEAGILGNPSEEAKRKFNEANVYAFFDTKRFHFVAPPDVAEQLNHSQLQDHDVADGLWFTKDGVGFKIGNEDNAPAMYLSRYAKRIISFYPDVVQWIRENPAPRSSVEPLLNWYRKLGAKFIEHGWHLLWRAVVYTSEGMDQVAKDLNDLTDEMKSDVNKWPDDTKIDGYKIWSGEKFSEMSWSTLKGMESGKPTSLAAVFHDDLEEVYNHYRVIVDRVVQSANATPTA